MKVLQLTLCLLFLGGSSSAQVADLPFGSEEPRGLENEGEVEAPAAEVSLFDGRSLSGWIAYAADDSVPAEDQWSALNGVLRTPGVPRGYLQSRSWYRDYELSLEWRWPEAPGNSGVLVHVSAPRIFGVWPRSLEVQLQSGEAGDFWVIGRGVDVLVENADSRRLPPQPGDRHRHRRVRNLTDGSERPVGEWNEMRIRCDGDTITVFVNGELVNQGTHATLSEGAVALQAEGAAIEFRNISIGPLAGEVP